MEPDYEMQAADHWERRDDPDDDLLGDLEEAAERADEDRRIEEAFR